jgi:hypothetical protein
MDHPLQIAALLFGPPFNSLVYNYIVKYKVEDAVAQNTQTYCDQVWIVINEGSIVEQADGWEAENNSKPIVLFQRMMMYRMVRSMPYP